MKKIKLFSFIIVSLLAVVFVFGTISSFALAQEQQESDGLFIEVNIRDAVIISQESNKFNISFDLTNGLGIQSQIKYGVQLVKDGVIADEQVYDEVVNLKENEILTKKVIYQAPDFLVGEYVIWIVAKSSAGMPLSIHNIGNVYLNGNDFYLEIERNTCYLQIEDEELHIKYTSLQGVDVSFDENIIAKCNIKNHFNIPIKFRPSFET